MSIESAMPSSHLILCRPLLLLPPIPPSITVFSNEINVELRDHFGSDKINASQWFEAQRLINAQNFYEKGHNILECLRFIGIDCKMDMQSNKLHCPECGINAY